MTETRLRMHPNGRWILIAALCFIILGTIVQHSVIVLWGEVIVVMLSAAYLVALSRGVRLRRGGIRVTACFSGDGQGRLTVGQRAELLISLTRDGTRGLVYSALRPVCSSMVASEVDATPLRLSRHQCATVSLSLTPKLSGTWHLFGVAVTLESPLNLFEHELYLPCPLEITAVPRGRPHTDWRALLHNVRTFDEKKGSHAVPTTGLSMELLELRDHTVGDPFKQIDWKASARMRKLIVRDYESELTLSVYLLLDISASMRWGAVGGRKLDFASDLLSTIARSILTNRDRVGLATFDHELHAFHDAQTGPQSYSRLLETLLDVNTVVHEPFTDDSDEELVDRVGDYLRWQEGHDYRRQGDASVDSLQAYEGKALRGLYDEARIHRHIDAVLSAQPRSHSVARRGGAALAESPEMARLRRFCRLKGIDLSYRLGLPTDKGNGLVRALERIYLRTRTPHFIIVLTDGIGLSVSDELVRLFQLLRRRHHHTFVLTPFGPDFEAATGDAPTAQLHLLHRFEERERIEALRQALGRRGVSFATCSPRIAIPTMLRQLYRFRQAR